MPRNRKKKKVAGQWTDPLGRNVTLTLSKWKLKLTYHPGMSGRLYDVGDTIMKPDVICKEDSDRVYYKKFSPDKVGNLYLKVPVTKDGVVKSAYPVRNIDCSGGKEFP